jgi:hypothetical protein
MFSWFALDFILFISLFIIILTLKKKILWKHFKKSVAINILFIYFINIY